MQTTGVMQRDFFDPPADELQLIVIGEVTVVAALRMVLSCEQCCPDEAQIPFDWILDKITGKSGATTDYIPRIAERQCAAWKWLPCRASAGVSHRR
jgi:hypothetical protein